MDLLLKAVIAAILTLLFEHAPKLIESIRLKRIHFILLGEWYGYHYSYKNGQTQMFKSTWNVKSGFFQPFKVEIVIEDILHYRGQIKFEGDDRIIVHGHATTQVEYPIYRFPNPLKTTGDILTGIWLSYDHDKHIAAGGAVLSRMELSEADVQKYLKNIRVARHISKPLPVLRCRK